MTKFKKIAKVNNLNIAIKSLLEASAALDTINMVNGSILSLKLASLVADVKIKKFGQSSETLDSVREQNSQMLHDTRLFFVQTLNFIKEVYINLSKFNITYPSDFTTEFGLMRDNDIMENPSFYELSEAAVKLREINFKVIEEASPKISTPEGTELFSKLKEIRDKVDDLIGKLHISRQIVHQISLGEHIQQKDQYNLNILAMQYKLPTIKLDGVMSIEVRNLINQLQDVMNYQQDVDIGSQDFSDSQFFSYIEKLVKTIPGYISFEDANSKFMNKDNISYKDQPGPYSRFPGA